MCPACAGDDPYAGYPASVFPPPVQN
ncbi:hypothetical protein [Agathobaculum butyriciproducens]